MSYSWDYSDAILIYYIVVTKIIPKLVTYVLDKQFNIQLSIKSVSVFDFCVRNVSLKYADLEMVIGELGLRSKFFSSSYHKAICVCIDDVKITGSGDGAVWKPIDYYQSGKVGKSMYEETLIKVLSYLRNYLPPAVMIMFQFLGVYIKQFNTIVLNKEKGPAVSLSIPYIELVFDGFYSNDSRKLCTALNLHHVRPKFYAYNKQNPERKPNNACLAEVVIDIKIQTTLMWRNNELVFEQLQLAVNDTQITFYGGLFDMIEHLMLHTKLHETIAVTTTEKFIEEKLSAPATDDTSTVDMVKLINTLTPSKVIIHVDNTEIKSLDKQNSYHYHLLLHHIEVKVEKFESSSPSSSSRLKISNLRIYTPDNEVVYIRDITVDAKILSEGVVSIGARVDTANVLYLHEDIYGWFYKIINSGLKSKRKELILKAFELWQELNMQILQSKIVQDIFDMIMLNIFLELNNCSMALQLEHPQISSLNVVKVKFNLRQSVDKCRVGEAYENVLSNLIFRNRHWSFEVVNQGQFCWYLGRKFDYLTKKGTYVRGSVLYAQNAFISLSTIDNLETPLRVKLRANTARVEYSTKLTYYVIQSIKNVREYIDLFKQLKSSDTNEEEGPPEPSEVIENDESAQKVLLDLQAEDVSLFFINRHEVCIFFSLSQVLCYDLQVFQLDSFHIATVDFTQCDSIYDLNELSTTHVSTKSLIVKFSAPEGEVQMEVDFNESFDVMWNAHCLRHWMSIVRDIRRFVRRIKITCGIQPVTNFKMPRSLPLGLDIKKLRNIAIKHSDVNVENLLSFLGDISSGNLFFYQYFN